MPKATLKSNDFILFINKFKKALNNYKHQINTRGGDWNDSVQFWNSFQEQVIIPNKETIINFGKLIEQPKLFEELIFDIEFQIDYQIEQKELEIIAETNIIQSFEIRYERFFQNVFNIIFPDNNLTLLEHLDKSVVKQDENPLYEILENFSIILNSNGVGFSLWCYRAEFEKHIDTPEKKLKIYLENYEKDLLKWVHTINQPVKFSNELFSNKFEYNLFIKYKNLVSQELQTIQNNIKNNQYNLENVESITNKTSLIMQDYYTYIQYVKSKETQELIPGFKPSWTSRIKNSIVKIFTFGRVKNSLLNDGNFITSFIKKHEETTNPKKIESNNKPEKTSFFSRITNFFSFKKAANDNQTAQNNNSIEGNISIKSQEEKIEDTFVWVNPPSLEEQQNVQLSKEEEEKLEKSFVWVNPSSIDEVQLLQEDETIEDTFVWVHRESEEPESLVQLSQDEKSTESNHGWVDSLSSGVTELSRGLSAI